MNDGSKDDRTLRGRYVLGEVLGEGGFGKTRAARDLETDGDVVIKELTVKGLPDWKPVEQFEREVKTLRSLDHPRIPALVDAFEEGEGDEVRLFIVTERVPGQSLARCISEGRRWSETEARELLEALLDTLIYLHGLSPRVIHRDIKPGNIIIRDDGDPVLVDFGAVRDLVTHQPDGAMTVLGTPGYMAPEQALGSADARSDIYGLGTTVLHALTHRHPTELPRDDMKFRFEHISGLPPGVVAVVMRMVEPDPAARFQRATDVLAALHGEQPALSCVRESAALARQATHASNLPARPDEPRALTPAIHQQLSLQNALIRDRKKLPLMMVFAAAAALALAALGPVSAVLAPVVMLAAIGTYFGVGKRTQLREREIYRSGTETRGEMYAARQGQQGVFIEYRFAADGTEYNGTFYTSDAMVTSRVRPGMPVRVFYDPENPSSHVAMADSDLLLPGDIPALEE